MKTVSPLKLKKRKTETNIFIRQFYAFLKEQGDCVHLKKLRGREGYYDPSTEEIAVDYRKEFISTMVHEVIHHLHPYWSESKVVSKEKEIMNTITVRQCKNMIVMIAKYT